MQPQVPFTAKQWQLQIADAWIGTATSAGSARYDAMRNLANGVEQLLNSEVHREAEATAVIDQLIPVLAHCDDLDFDTSEQSLAYISWHLLDRYGRIQQTLDALCRTGDLPIRKQTLTLLEVGAGPAPASYAVSDYYWQFAEWSRATGQLFEPTAEVLFIRSTAVTPGRISSIICPSCCRTVVKPGCTGRRTPTSATSRPAGSTTKASSMLPGEFRMRPNEPTSPSATRLLASSHSRRAAFLRVPTTSS